MPTIARTLDDLLLDAIAAKIIAFRDNQISLDPAVNFDIDVDRARPWDSLVPLVNLISTADDYDASGSSTKTVRAGKLTVKAQCWAPIASSRLRYLKAQVLTAVHAHDSPDFDEPVGEINLGWPSWSRLDFDDTDLETDVFVGEWRWEVNYAWEPEDISGPALSSVSIDTGLWSALYNFGGNP
jgi:hypothetical protein